MSTYLQTIHNNSTPAQITSQSKQQLHKEIRNFRKTGILFPIQNDKLSPQDHYINTSSQMPRRIPGLLFDRIRKLHISVQQRLLPKVIEPIQIHEIRNNGIRSWYGDTTTTRKKYDQWYWKTKLRRIPYCQSLLYWNEPLMTKLQQKAHKFHLEAAIQRNSHLEGPPKWMILQSIDWD